MSDQTPQPVLLYLTPDELGYLAETLARTRGKQREAMRAIARQIIAIGVGELDPDALPELADDLVIADADGVLFLTMRVTVDEVWFLPFSDRDAVQCLRSAPDPDNGTKAVGMFSPTGQMPQQPLRAVGRLRDLSSAGITRKPRADDIDPARFPVIINPAEARRRRQS